VSDRAYDQLYEEVLALCGPDVTIAKVNEIVAYLHDGGVRPWTLRRLKAAGFDISFGVSGLAEPRRWFVGCQRWPTPCWRCGTEVKRGQVIALGKLDNGDWCVACPECRAVDPASEQADAARKRAVEKDADPEELIERMAALAAPELHERIEDLLSVVVAAQERG